MNSKKIAIVGILNNPSTSENHHSSGAVEIVSKLFNADIASGDVDWNDYESLIIYHGPNFREGIFNVIGGISEDVIHRTKKLQNYKGKIYSLDKFQLKDFLRKRLLDESYNLIHEQIELPQRDRIVIGDSHSISVWPDERYTISRNDGKTLYGFLKQQIDLRSYIHTILYFGNIDIRFHLARQADPKKATRELFIRYCDYASKISATITNLIPIESEDRKIPKSGMYKGVAFFGSQNLRQELVNIANEVMNTSGLQTIKWPTWFMKNNIMLIDILEPKQSVHIRPKYYIRHMQPNEKTVQGTLF